MIAQAITVLDFETTGAVPGYPNEPWQMGWQVVCDGALAGGPPLGHWLRVGDRPFNRHAPGRHAQVRDVLRAAPSLHDLWPHVRPWLLGRPLAAHNAATEKTVLAATFPLHRFGPWIDTLVLARKAWPGLRSHALEDLVPVLGLSAAVSGRCPGLEPHDARYDAVAAAELLCLVLRQPGWRDLTLEDLGRLA